MTQRIQAIDPAAAQGQTKRLHDSIAAQFDSVPNIVKTFAQSPAVLAGFLSFSRTLAKGTLNAKLREQIALTVAGSNGCNYCASAHSYLAKATGVDGDEVVWNLKGIANGALSACAVRPVNAANSAISVTI